MPPRSNALRQDSTTPRPPRDLHQAAFQGNLYMTGLLLSKGADVNALDYQLGMTPLQIAVGMNHLSVARALVAADALFTPDPRGRMPSLIAIECCTSEEMQDFIVEAETERG